jgi:hypothetical protein
MYRPKTTHTSVGVYALGGLLSVFISAVAAWMLHGYLDTEDRNGSVVWFAVLLIFGLAFLACDAWVYMSRHHPQVAVAALVCGLVLIVSAWYFRQYWPTKDLSTLLTCEGFLIISGFASVITHLWLMTPGRETRPDPT